MSPQRHNAHMPRHSWARSVEGSRLEPLARALLEPTRMGAVRAYVAVVTLACWAACESQHAVQIAVTSTDNNPVVGAIIAVICRLDATVDGAAAATDLAGLATVTLIQRDSRELSHCELTVAAAGYLTQQQAIDLCDEDMLADCVVSVSLAVAP